MDTARRHILINTHYMPIGGAEKALLGLLDAIDKEKYQVTVMINRHTGELMDKLLKMKGVYVCDEDFDCKLVLGPLSESIKEHKFGMAYAKIKSRVCHAVYRSKRSCICGENGGILSGTNEARVDGYNPCTFQRTGKK